MSNRWVITQENKRAFDIREKKKEPKRCFGENRHPGLESQTNLLSGIFTNHNPLREKDQSAV